MLVEEICRVSYIRIYFFFQRGFFIFIIFVSSAVGREKTFAIFLHSHVRFLWPRKRGAENKLLLSRKWLFKLLSLMPLYWLLYIYRTVNYFIRFLRNGPFSSK